VQSLGKKRNERMIRWPFSVSQEKMNRWGPREGVTRTRGLCKVEPSMAPVLVMHSPRALFSIKLHYIYIYINIFSGFIFLNEKFPCFVEKVYALWGAMFQHLKYSHRALHGK
jgi:hypothetical protein